ncbi:hypothetical protein ABES03_11615 [Neobacillus rhizosphaerae]|uniref:hypothetical protein n=1 Tax=Neobacillus rhizosphaerae TaxID=2880965 RepID=UPI003D29BB3F
MMNLIKKYNIEQNSNSQQSFEPLLFIPGLWVNGKYYWLQDCTEKVIYDEEMTIKVKHEQIHSKIRVSSIFVSNHGNQMKEIKVLAMHHFSNIGKDHLTFVSPLDNRIFHHANKQVYLVNAHYQRVGLTEYTAMPLWNVYTDQIWSSLQTGTLKYQPLAKDPAASVFALKMTIQPHETGKMNTWTINGTNKNELITMEQALMKNTLAFPFEK